MALTHESIHNHEPAHQNNVPTHVSVANSAKWINSWHLRVRLDSALERTQISSSENLYTHDYFYTRLRCTVDRYSLNRSPSILNSSPLVCIEILIRIPIPFSVVPRGWAPRNRSEGTDWRTDGRTRWQTYAIIPAKTQIPKIDKYICNFNSICWGFSFWAKYLHWHKKCL